MLAVIVWIAAYANLTPFADAVLTLTGLPRQTHLGEALHFFFYDTPKVLLLLTAIVFVMGIVHTFISPERTRAFLSGRRLGVGNVLAATLGIVTPFCSCSAPEFTAMCPRTSWPASWARTPRGGRYPPQL